MKFRAVHAYFVACIAALAIESPRAATPLETRAEIVAGATQTVHLAQRLPQRFTLRVTDRDGRPLPGVQVYFTAGLCTDMGQFPGCPPFALYGSFDPATSIGSFSGLAVSDGDGIAVAPPFTAGAIVGSYDVFAYVPPQRVGDVDLALTFFPLRFSLQQVLPPAPSMEPDRVPAGGVISLMLLAGLLLCVAKARLASRPD